MVINRAPQFSQVQGGSDVTGLGMEHGNAPYPTYSDNVLVPGMPKMIAKLPQRCLH
jgi:hypothetical protein